MSPYEVLGVEPSATPEQIKSAYRKLAMEHHPDRNGGSEASLDKFREIQEAYDALTKPKQNQRQQHESPFDDHPFSWAFSGGEFRARTPPRRNASFQTQTEISLEDAYKGTELTITVEDRIVTIVVPAGVQHGQRLSVEGQGSHELHDLPPGDLFVYVSIRPHAVFQVSGPNLLTIKDVDAIDLMLGTDVKITTISGETLSVVVPAGASHRTRLRVPGKGMPRGQEHGDIFVQINPVFPDLTDEQKDRLRQVRS